MSPTTRRCDTCGVTKQETKFKPHPDHPGTRLPTCRDCTPGTRIIRCTDCGNPRRTKSHNTRFCHLCALRRKLVGTAKMRPWKCSAPGCHVKFARLHLQDRACAKHHATHLDRMTWATGDCRFCEVQSGLPIWAVSVPVCVGCLKDPEKRDAILTWTQGKTPQAQAAKAHDAVAKQQAATEAEQERARRNDALDVLLREQFDGGRVVSWPDLYRAGNAANASIGDVKLSIKRIGAVEHHHEPGDAPGQRRSYYHVPTPASEAAAR